jgi:LPXTG-site transpeptidase (sortase) family protein
MMSVLGIMCFLAILFFVKFFYVNPSLSASNPVVQDFHRTVSGLPFRLVIPKIKVDASIEYVGLTAQGTMAVPKGPTSTAWFDLGPRPGDDGSAVIAGHEGWKDGIGAVFDDLYKLQVGDVVYIKDKNGITTTFVVRKIYTYDQNADASDVFGSNDGKAHLNLITCEGTWNAAQKSYSGRLVVFADKE